MLKERLLVDLETLFPLFLAGSLVTLASCLSVDDLELCDLNECRLLTLVFSEDGPDGRLLWSESSEAVRFFTALAAARSEL